MEAIRTTRDAGGIVTITMDLPGKPVNTCSPQLLAELGQAIDAIEKDPPKAVIIASVELLTRAQKAKPKLLWGGIGDVGDGMDIRSVQEWSGSLTNDGWMFGDTSVGSFLRSDQMKKIMRAAGDFDAADMDKSPAYIVELFVSLVYFGMILKLAKRRMGKNLSVPLAVGHPDSEEIFLVG